VASDDGILRPENLAPDRPALSGVVRGECWFMCDAELARFIHDLVGDGLMGSDETVGLA